jgi:hypothetical protein
VLLFFAIGVGATASNKDELELLFIFTYVGYLIEFYFMISKLDGTEELSYSYRYNSQQFEESKYTSVNK